MQHRRSLHAKKESLRNNKQKYTGKYGSSRVTKTVKNIHAGIYGFYGKRSVLQLNCKVLCFSTACLNTTSVTLTSYVLPHLEFLLKL